MVYRFTYYYNNNLIYETFIDETKATAKFFWLISKKIPFKIITSTKRHNRYI